jgi:arylsulfatase
MPSRRDRPNVLLLYTDQQRFDALGYTGNRHIRTPHLDALAATGGCFSHAYCNSPVCMPSRQSMLSGQYPSALGTTTNGIEMREETLTLQRVLKPYGYTTANLGKLHFCNHSNRDHREPHPAYGFDRLVLSDEPGCYDDAYIKWVEMRAPDQVEACRVDTPPAWQGTPRHRQPRGTTTPYVFQGPEHLTHTAFVADETIRFLEDAQAGPFFAVAGFYAPHAPINPPQRFVDLYDPAEMPLPLRNPGEDRTGLSDDDWRRVVAFYYALVSHIDDQIGRILAAVDALGLRENTLILFTSDHGEHLGDHGLVAKGPPGLDSCARVPLIASCPARFGPLGVRNELIEAVDLAPTILDMCGVQVPPVMQGRSFRGLLEGRGYTPRRSAFIEHRVPFGTSWKTVVTQEFKYAASNGGDELLFDLAHDPHELHNVAAAPECAGALAEMRAELLRRWFDVEHQYPLRTAAY